jgi:hypothetical protein
MSCCWFQSGCAKAFSGYDIKTVGWRRLLLVATFKGSLLKIGKRQGLIEQAERNGRIFWTMFALFEYNVT